MTATVPDRIFEIDEFEDFSPVYDENGKDQFGFYESIDAYNEANLLNKFTYGDKELPRIFQRGHGAMNFRRRAPIMAFVGRNGGGKSLAAVNDTIPTLNGQKWRCRNTEHYHFRAFGQTQGYRKVVSSLRMIDPRTGQDHPLWIPLDDHRRLLTIEHADILADEVQGVASSDESTTMPVQVKNVLAQLRRQDVYLRWTTPNWTSAAKPIRNVTTYATQCQSFLRMPVDGRAWNSGLLFYWKTYEAGKFEGGQVLRYSRVHPDTYQWYNRTAPHNLAQSIYDTYAPVLTAGATNDAGICMECGGRRSIPTCDCDKRYKKEGGRAFVDGPENLARIAAKLGLNPFFERELLSAKAEPAEKVPPHVDEPAHQHSAGAEHEHHQHHDAACATNSGVPDMMRWLGEMSAGRRPTDGI